jgi:serine/threonine-protein kinase
MFKFNSLPFLIDDLIVESGQRTVYTGHRTEDGGPVVIKVLLYNEIRIARIQREIGILESINSTYFPHFYCKAFISKEIIEDYIDNLSNKEEIECLRANIPKPFFVTCEEYIENITWRVFKEALRDEAMIVDFVCHLFKALDLLWSNKIVHRDIKPDNILIRPNLQPVVIDLGIAKSLRAGTAAFTVPGFVPCTPQYAAPEQLQMNADLTPRVDQFAVGVILYHLLTATYPYGDVEEIEVEGLLTRLRTVQARPVQELNGSITAGFAQFVNRLLEIEPYRRFRNTSAILSALSEIKGDCDANSPPSRPQFHLESEQL